jgi:hypothetical protein
MKPILKKIITNIRALGFSTLTFVLLETLAWVSSLRDLNIYLVITVFGLSLFLVELFISWLIAKREKIAWEMPSLQNRAWREHFVNHSVLPLLMFLFTAVFLWNNNVEVFKQLFVIMISLIFVPLFVNLHATYRNEMKLRKETNYIFDLVRIVIFFLVVDASLDIFSFSLGGVSGSVFTVMTTAFILLFLMVWLSKQVSIESLLFIILSSMLVGVFYFLIIFIVVLNPLTVAVISTTVFFLIVSYWHHKLDGTFDFHVFSEYLLIVFLLLVILVGLSR